MKIKIRYNTEKDKIDENLLPWRILIEGKERLASKVTINTKSWTTQDEIAPGVFKWHVACEGTPHWNKTDHECVINDDT